MSVSCHSEYISIRNAFFTILILVWISISSSLFFQQLRYVIFESMFLLFLVNERLWVAWFYRNSFLNLFLHVIQVLCTRSCRSFKLWLLRLNHLHILYFLFIISTITFMHLVLPNSAF